MQCEFCTEFAATGPDSRIITETNGWVLLPTIGCFTPGYCLFMPVCHLDAAADAPLTEMATIQGAQSGPHHQCPTAFSHPPGSLMAAAQSAVATLHELSAAELEVADPRYPKWSTMCRLRLLRLPVLNAVLITPGIHEASIAPTIEALARAVGRDQLMLRSDGGTETSRYYRGGNSFPVGALSGRVTALLHQGRAAILLEPTNRYANRMTALLRMDRATASPAGQFTIEALGPGYDAADLTRGGISPQVTVTADTDWSTYREPWWSDLRLTQDQSPAAETARRHQRLTRLAAHVLTDVGHPVRQSAPADPAAAAEAWLRQHGYLALWDGQDIAAAVSSRAKEWFDDAFLIAKCHPSQSWTCLATATSNLGSGRWTFWDIVDGNRKYGPALERA